MAIELRRPVVHDATTRKHTPAAPADQFPGSILQLSADAGNGVSLGSDGGLFVPAAVAQFPDDQVFTGSTLGSVALTLTPSAPNSEGQVDYTIAGSVKLAPAQAAGDNQLQVIDAGLATEALYVAPEVTTTGTINAPTLTTGPELPTDIYGDRAALMGNPTGWARLANGQVVPTYTEGGGAGAPVAPAVAKQVEFGFAPSVINDFGSNRIVTVTFATAFPTAPFVSFTADSTPTAGTPVFGDIAVLNVTTTGFTIHRGMNISNDYLPGVHWKAEEK